MQLPLLNVDENIIAPGDLLNPVEELQEAADHKQYEYLEVKKEFLEKEYIKDILVFASDIEPNSLNIEKIPDILTVGNFLKYLVDSKIPQEIDGYKTHHASLHHNFQKGRCKTCDVLVKEMKDNGVLQKTHIDMIEENHLEVDKDFPQYFGESCSHFKVRFNRMKLKFAINILKKFYYLSMEAHFNEELRLRDLYLSIVKSLYLEIKESELELNFMSENMYQKLKAVDTERTLEKIEALYACTSGIKNEKFSNHLLDHAKHLNRGIMACKDIYSTRGRFGYSAEVLIEGESDMLIYEYLDSFLHNKREKREVPHHLIKGFMDHRKEYFSDILEGVTKL